MGKIDKNLLIGLARRQLFSVALVAAFAGIEVANGGEWIGWPFVVVASVLVNLAWSFVA